MDYDKIIEEICNLIETNGTINGFNSDDLYDKENILKEELLNDSEFQFQKKLNKIRYYYDLNESMFPLTFHNIFKVLKQNQTYSYNKFKEELDKELTNHKQLEIKEFSLYFPINIEFEKKVRKIQIEDTLIEFLDYKEVKGIYDNEEIKLKLKYNKTFKKNEKIYLKISLRARNIIYAKKKATDKLDLILGILGFAHKFRRITTNIMGFVKPQFEIILSFIFVYENNNYKTYYYYKTSEMISKNIKINSDRLDLFKLTLKQYLKSNKGIKEIIENSFSLYYLGLNEEDVDYAFFSFWRVLELLCLKEIGQKHIDIINLFKSFLLDINKELEMKIDRVYSLRNTFVHTGKANITQRDVNKMKTFAETMLDVFMTTMSKYNKEEIKILYSYFLKKDLKKLELDKSLLNKVIKIKKDTLKRKTNQ